MKQLISGIHHVALKCQGTEAFEQTVHFYRDILGMKVARSWGEGRNAGIMLDTGSGLMEIFANAQDVREQGAIRLIRHELHSASVRWERKSSFSM